MNPTLRQTLLRHIRCQVRVHEVLAPYTSFRIGGPAEILAEPATVDELLETLRLVRESEAPFFYLGLGSNLLIADDGFDGVVIRARGELDKISMIGEVDVEAGPSARLLRLTTFAAVRNLSGMEPLSGIPGTVGGGLFMNAGAYGGEISDILADVDAVTSDGELVRMEREEIRFGYRTAPELQDCTILRSRYRFARGDRRSIFGEMRRVWRLRREKQPLDFPSAGSIFKRPPGFFAGKLIEDVGGKGLRVGGAMVSPKHAGIFINAGGATAKDVAALVREVRQRVYDQFHVLLENEVKPVGFKEDPFAVKI
jgi:UDP-N-acetylmuramate dehydrogenase